MEFYRYEIQRYASTIDDSVRPHIIHRLVVHEYSLVKETPKGYWIAYGSMLGLHGGKRWVSKTSKKRYAYPSKEEALNAFIHRTKRRIKFLENDIYEASYGLKEAERLLEGLLKQ